VRGSVHFLLSSAFSYPICWAVTRSPETALPLALAVGCASLLPDLDHGAGLAAGILRVRWLSGLVQATVGHRSGWTHSAPACLVWALLWGVLAGVLTAPGGQEASLSWAGGTCLVVLGGGLLHVLADACTPAGCPLLAPFSRRRVRFRLRPGRRSRRPPSPSPSPSRRSRSGPPPDAPYSASTSAAVVTPSRSLCPSAAASRSAAPKPSAVSVSTRPTADQATVVSKPSAPNGRRCSSVTRTRPGCPENT
jgi:membrane-bound metal-dependent hydrolase YbcI (DUF457 family)